MCGIAGVLSENSGEATLRAMCDDMIARGPDEEGYLHEDGGQLGIRRLSIVNPEGGQQPVYNNDDSIVAVCNGEIYNHQNLRKQLQKTGTNITSGSDVAVLPYLYEEHGPEFVKQLRGMFALAIWDRRRSSLILGRDRLGQKPLFYFQSKRELYFASTLQALKQGIDRTPEINRNALGQYLTSNRVPSPHCIYRNIQKVAPAHTVQFNLESQSLQPRRNRYWSLSFQDKLHSDEKDLTDKLEDSLTEAVKVRLMSDVPLGFFLSGGVDSSLVTALARKAGAEPLRTFSVGFEDEEFSELEEARIVSDHLDTDHQEMVIRPDEPERIRQMIRHLDEPFADASFIPASYVSELASDHVKTVLTGDGADESLGGYEWYRALRYALIYNHFPGWFRRLIGSLSKILPRYEVRSGLLQSIRRFKTFAERLETPANHPLDLFHQLMGNNSDQRQKIERALKDKSLLNSQYREDRRRIFDQYDGDSPIEGIMYTQMRTLLPDLFFTKIDRMSMMHSLEARSPFADHKLQEFIARVPLTYKHNGSTGKYLIKKVAERHLPNSIIYRQKMGFSIPIGRWLREGPYRDFARDIFHGNAFGNRGLFEPQSVKDLMEEHESQQGDHWVTLWTILCLELWYQECHNSA